jgi:hypothetical protein
MRDSGRFVLLLLALLTVRPALADERELSVIELRHRLPEDMVPLIQPLLGPTDTIIPNRNQLIVKARPETISEIRALLDQLDKSPHRLLITVSQGGMLSRETFDAGAQVRGRIDLNRPDHSGADIRGYIDQSEGQDSTGGTQQVQTLEGRPALIQAGSQIPVRTPSPYYGYGGGIEYRAVTTGFAVTPRLAGGEVLIEIEPWSDRLSRGRGGVIDTQSAHTVLKAALGEWVEVGGNVETMVQEQNGLTERSTVNQSRESRIFLKVEDLDVGKP